MERNRAGSAFSGFSRAPPLTLKENGFFLFSGGYFKQNAALKSTFSLIHAQTKTPSRKGRAP